MTLKSYLIITLLLGLIVPPTSASIFDSIWNSITNRQLPNPQNQIKDAVQKITEQANVNIEAFNSSQSNHGVRIQSNDLKFQAHISDNGLQIRLDEPDKPLSFDWRDHILISPAKNIGQCRAYSSYASVAYAQAKLEVSGGYQYKYGPYYDLSEQYIIECGRGIDSCEGGSLEDVFFFLEGGLPYEQDAQQYHSDDYLDFCQEAYYYGDFSYFGYQSVFTYNLTDQELITLVQYEPIVVTFYGENQLKNYKGGIFECPASPSPAIDTAGLLVGYTPEYWIIKYSLGTDWGENGYVRVTRKPEKNCNIGYSVAHMYIYIYKPQSTVQKIVNPLKDVFRGISGIF